MRGLSGDGAFDGCTSLHEMLIPRSVNMIKDSAFNGCTSLTSVVFCNEIEEFVSSEWIQEWWNCGAHDKSLSTYFF
jgi:hypothetical protein